MTIIGSICIIVAAIWILYKIYTAYTSFGGTVMVTVYDAVIYPPVLAAFGLYWVLPYFKIDWSIWIYLAIGVGIAIVTWLIIRLAEELGDRSL